MALPSNHLDRAMIAIRGNVIDEESMKLEPAQHDLSMVHPKTTWKMVMDGPALFSPNTDV
eukprot:12924573-Prorocentrum_lima.AAC.1